MKIPYFNYAAIAVLLVIIISALIRKAYRGRANGWFLVCTVVVLITTTFDIFAVHLDNLGPGNVTAKYIAHGGYLIFHTASSLFYLFYIIALTDTYFKFIKSRAKKFIVFVPILVYLVIFIAGFFDGFPVYFIDANDVYNRGNALIAGYIVGGIYIVYGIYYILHCRRLFTNKLILTLFTFYPFILIAMAVEFLVPTMIVELFANAISLLCVAFYVQKPEEMNDPVSELGNNRAYEEHIRRNYINERAFTDIVISVKNYSTIVKLLNYEGQRRTLRKVGDYLRGLDSQYRLTAGLYNTMFGTYHILVSDKDGELVDRIATEVMSFFNSSHFSGDVELSSAASVMVVNVPEDIREFELFRRFVNGDMGEMSTESVQYASELMKEDYYKLSINIDKIIDDAITGNRIEMYYQPIYSVPEGKYIAAESLMRINDPEYGMISPAIFIPAAERSGAINQLWNTAINQVCRFVASEEYAKLGIRFVDVNLSPIQCMHSGLADDIISIIDSYGVPHDTINIEITETAFAYDEEILMQNIKKLDEAGIGMSLDDYGTGYSDTARVLSLPLKIIKLDRSFVLFAENERLKSVVRNTIRMLKEIDVEIIAEGIETESLVNEISGMGCDYIQGWYYSRALSESSFIQFVEEENAG